jgi:hypothetical protein
VPVGIGTFRFTVQVRDNTAQTASQPLTITILSSGVKPLKGYWSFDDNTAMDNSGFRDDGTLVGNPSFVAGVSGKALSLDGVSQYVTLPFELDPGSGNFSVFAWVKSSQPNGRRIIVSKRDASSSTNSGYQLFQNSNGALSFTVGNELGQVITINSTSPKINDGNWHWVGAVLTRASTGDLYVDGQPAQNGTADISSINGNTIDAAFALRLGAEEQTNIGTLWQGAIDEVRIYTRRFFSPTEVANLYNQPLKVLSTDLNPATQGVSYSQLLAASGGVPPYVWSIASGSNPPPGLQLLPDGTLQGIPTSSGDLTFTARLDDQASHTTTQLINLKVYGTAPTLLPTDDFASGNWFIVDPPNPSEGPSHWVPMNGEFIQTSNVFSGDFDGTNPVKPGTYALDGQASWTDYDFSVHLMAEDNDAFGVMFRYQSDQSYYRFSMDSERHYRRLAKVVGSNTISLVEDAVPYELGESYNLRISVKGATIKVFLDQTQILQYTDPSPILSGKIALYCWGDEYSHFNSVAVTTN